MRDLVVLLVLGGLVQATRSFRPHTGEVSDVAATALAFGFLLLAAFYAGRVFARLRLPKIVAYIVTGIVVGPSALDLVSEPMLHGLDLVNGVAVCLIALTAGGELEVERFAPLLRTIRSLSIWAVCGTCITLTALLLGLRPLLPFLAPLEGPALLAVCAMIGIAASAQSPAVVMALLSETRADGPVSRTILGTVVVADLVVIVLFGIASSLAQAATGGGADPVGTALGILWELLGSMVAGVVIGALLAAYLRHVRQGLSLFVMLLCVVVSQVGARIHLDPLIVMLAVGVFVVNVVRSEASRLVRDIQGASLPVYLVFFALAGARLHLGLVVTLAVPALILVVGRAASFRLGSAIATARAKADPAVRRHAWTGLLPQAGLALALALLIKRALPGIGDDASALVLAVITVNELVMPIVLRHALLASGEAGKRDEAEVLGSEGSEEGEGAVEETELA